MFCSGLFRERVTSRAFEGLLREGISRSNLSRLSLSHWTRLDLRKLLFQDFLDLSLSHGTGLDCKKYFF